MEFYVYKYLIIVNLVHQWLQFGSVTKPPKYMLPNII